MTVFATWRAHRRLWKNQWRDREAIRRWQSARLQRLVESAGRHVPYYRDLLARARVTPESIRSVDDLARIPITTKRELQAQHPRSLLDLRAAAGRLSPQHSSGSTGRPFTVQYDRGFRALRDALFLRALRTAGYRFGSKLMLVTSARPSPTSWLRPRWRYASIEEGPADLCRTFLEFAPEILYGCVTPLRLLAEELIARGYTYRPPLGVVTTAETLDSGTRRILAESFASPVFDVYGLTEMGVVGWECAEHGGYHLAEDTTIVEFVPFGVGGECRLVMTNLELLAMPFLRYDTGDLGVLDQTARCRCGRTFSLLRRVEGRFVDCVRLRDGRRISPYRLTCEIEKLAGLSRYQVVQNRIDSFVVRVERGTGRDVPPEDAIRSIVQDIVGGTAKVDIELLSRLVPAPGRKFRVVESELGEDNAP
jgi:phenylacetate-CoA ligase